MLYKNRIVENRVQKLFNAFKTVLIVGARQVGKSSLLKHLYPETQTFTFDPVQDLYRARQDPDLFLKNFPPPLILDEIQYVPELIPALKRSVDTTDKKGQYLLTGSQQFSVIKNISESLAGRVGIVHLLPMTPLEMYGNYQGENWLNRYLSDPENFPKSHQLLTKAPEIYEALWRGGMPGTIELANDLLPDYFSSYIQTYVERDIRLLENITDLGLFSRFFSLLGALTSQEINHSQLGREIGISPTTAQRWLHVILYTYQWHEVWPYHGNSIKRISKKSKGYLSDTGIACYLHRITSYQALAGHPLLGALFETFCFNIIKALSSGLQTMPHFYHWRTAAGAEVDLVLEQNDTLYPIEIKCKTNLSGNDTRGIRAFRETYPHKKIAPGLLIYAGSHCYWLNENTIALPWNTI